MITPSQRESARTALAFIRATNNGDTRGATAILETLEPTEWAEFAAALAGMTAVALKLGQIPQQQFFVVMGDYVETRLGSAK